MKGFTKKCLAYMICLGLVSLVTACSLGHAPNEPQAKEYRRCRADYVAVCHEKIEKNVCNKYDQDTKSSRVEPVDHVSRYDLAPLGGLSFKPLFESHVENDGQRFDRLEQVVQQLRNELDLIVPKFVEMSQKEKQAWIDKATSLRHLSASSALSAVKEERYQPPVYAVPDASINSIRMADHKDKTRVVLDITDNVKIKTTLANKGKTLVVDLSNVSWDTKRMWLATTGSLISGYRVEGNNLYVDLMYSSQITTRLMLRPDSKVTSYHRLVIDLVSSDVHQK